METNFNLMEMKLWWQTDYSENPILCRRKMTNRAFDKFREHVLSVYVSHIDTKFCYVKISFAKK